jgi:hypothetical protein
LLRDVKTRYAMADPETQRRILLIMLEKVVLRPGDEYLEWKEPFATMKDMVRVGVSSGAEVGLDSIHHGNLLSIRIRPFVEYLRHNSISSELQALQQVIARDIDISCAAH